MGSSKWTWRVDLDENNLRELIRGADRQDQLPHLGYDQDLPSKSLISQTSEVLDPADLEDPDNKSLQFEGLSKSVTLIPPDLHPHEIPTYSTMLLASSSNELVDSNPDPVIEAFTKWQKDKLKAQTKANKLVMQDKLNDPVSYCDYRSNFNPRMSLIPCCPWLFPVLPVLLALTNEIMCINLGTYDNAIHVPDSDDAPGHINIPDSNTSLTILTSPIPMTYLMTVW